MLGGPEGMVLLVLVLVLFGGAQLPKLARNLGRAQKEFKDGLADATRTDPDALAKEITEPVAKDVPEPVVNEVAESS
jgi:sec-independent protein translocase protein TatA